MKIVPRILLIAFIALLNKISANCQLLATFTVNAQPATVAIPVYIDLNNITQQNDSLIVLKEITKNNKK